MFQPFPSSQDQAPETHTTRGAQGHPTAGTSVGLVGSVCPQDVEQCLACGRSEYTCDERTNSTYRCPTRLSHQLSPVVAQPVSKSPRGSAAASGASHPFASQFSPVPSLITCGFIQKSPEETKVFADPLKRQTAAVMNHHSLAGR